MINLLFYGGAFWISCIIFTVDLLLPTGVAVGLGYVILVIIGIWAPSRSYIYWAAAAGTVLTILGFFVSPLSGEVWKAVTNRALSAAVIWATAIICLRRQRTGPIK